MSYTNTIEYDGLLVKYYIPDTGWKHEDSMSFEVVLDDGTVDKYFTAKVLTSPKLYMGIVKAIHTDYFEFN